MSSPDIDDLRAELEALRAENRALRAADPDFPDDEVAPATRRAGKWRAFASALCIVLAGILVPISIVGAWARTELVSEEAFVQTFAPLADDPGVQQVVIDQASAAVNDAVDVDALTNDLFDGIAALDLPPRAQSALALLREPAAAGIHNLIDSSITRVVQSDAFPAVWRTTLVASHRALLATAAGGTANGAVTIDDSGTLGIELGPIIDALKERLVDQGIGFAASIPTIQKTIVIVQSDALLLVGTVYGLAVTVGWWLPVIALALFALGIALARRRSVAVLGTGIAIAVGGGALAAALTGASAVLGLNAGAIGIPSQTLESIFFAVVGAMRDTGVVFLFLGIVVALAAWLSGRSRAASRARALSSSLTGGARASLRRRGLDTGRFGDWLFRQRVLVRVIILALAIILLFSLRPLSIGDIVLTVVLGLVVWLVAALLERSPLDPAAGAPVDPGTGTVIDPVAPDAAAAADADAESLAPEPTDDDLVRSAVAAAATDATSAGAVQDPDTTATLPIDDAPAPSATTQGAQTTDAATGPAAASVPPKKPRAPRAR